MKYIAQIFTNYGIKNIPCDTITAARKEAEAYGTTASSCAILTASGKCIARHVRDDNGDGTRWFKAN